ncbi:MAG: hypothetical protein RJQ00_06435 [Vicingaceae bacterium]
MIEQSKYIDYYAERVAVLEQFDKTQITLTNTTKEEQWIKVWGANEGNLSSNKERVLKTDTYPQAIAFNPVNNFIYIVNQLAATLQVFDHNDELVSSLQLDSSSIPTASPIAITINNTNGEAYILGSLSDSLYVVNSNIELTNTIQLEDRPVSIKFNPSNQKLYIQHLIGKGISIVDTSNLTIELIETTAAQKDIALDAINGSWAVVSDEGETIKIFDSSNQLTNNFDFENRALTSISYTFEDDKLLAIDQESDELLSINITDGSILQSSTYNAQLKQLKTTDDGSIIVATSEPNQICILDNELKLIQAISIKAEVADFYLDETSQLIYSVDSVYNQVHILNSKEEIPIASFSSNYQEVLADFQHQPILVKHLRVFYSGTNDRPFFRVGFKSSAGKRESRLVSLLKYHSPQHYSKIYDITELNNYIIDGKAFWEVFVPPKLSVSLLIYHE